MRETIGWSYDLLPSAAQALFRRLAVFEAACSLPAMEAVDADTSDPHSEVLLDGIEALIGNSLLR